MTVKELQVVERLLLRCQPQDAHVAQALALVRKDLAAYEARKGQLREMYEPEEGRW